MKTTSVHCVAAAKLSIESPLVEKPAVGIVVRACATDWYGDIRSSMPVAPYAKRIRKSAAVRAM